MEDKPKKIFLADDDEAIVDATSMMLEMEGYSVAHTLDGNAVYEALLKGTDLLLLDIWMSGVDGRDVCRRLKADPLTREIPVLMISASREIRDSALASGADDFLAKPFDLQDLLDKISNLLLQ